MSELPFALEPALAERLRQALDREGKILRALADLGSVAGRDVVLVGGAPDSVTAGLSELGARVTETELSSPLRIDAPDEAADGVIGLWSAFRGADPAETAEVDRVLRPGGRQLAVHDYGRDDVSRLLDDRPEYASWGHRSGPFLSGGFRVRVIHCWWSFDALPDAVDFLSAAFGDRGRALGDTLRRPRLSYKVAVYHRTRTGGDA